MLLLAALGVAAALVLVMVASAGARPAQAQNSTGTTITVNTTDDEDNTDGDCSLREAIKAANTNRAADGCPAGSRTGEDAIGFALSSSAATITLGSTLPTITGTAGLVIDGGTQADVTVSGDDKVQVFNTDWGAKLALRNLAVVHGKATGSTSGAGIYSRGTLEVSNSTFSQNNAELQSGGGIESVGQGTLTVSNSTFSKNNAGHTGGGIDSWTNLTVSNSTFSENDSLGGGIAIRDAQLTVSNSTFSVNNAGGGFGGGIYNGSGTARISSTILDGDPSGRNCYNYAGAVTTDGGYNIEDANSCGFSQANNSQPNTDPGFEKDGQGNPVLKDNGGPTKTIALLPTSPAIDQGKSFGATTDQRGETRPHDYAKVQDAPNGDASDIGAFELTITNTAPDAIDDSASTQEDTPLDVAVLDNDTDPDTGDALTVTEVSDPAHGQAAVKDDKKTVEYTPDEHYNGPEDTFTYTVKDALGETDTAKVTITVSAVNDAPEADAQSVSTTEDAEKA
ncbi:MAG: hypothetical protein AVDCRST_MAG78-1469, partial [uncultured Rubrobacteraceae bacterium]